MFCTQNLINEKFNIVLKPYEHQGSNIMSYDIEGAKRQPQHEFDTRTYGCQNK
jgi:hypothetical protein